MYNFFRITHVQTKNNITSKKKKKKNSRYLSVVWLIPLKVLKGVEVWKLNQPHLCMKVHCWGQSHCQLKLVFKLLEELNSRPKREKIIVFFLYKIYQSLC